MQDTLQRRIRFAPPQPVDKYIDLSDTDIALFEAIHRHGPLPSHYLRAFTTRTNVNAFADRLTKLYNGTQQGGYLSRPPQQFESFRARYQQIVYDLNTHSEKVLRERGKLSPYIKRGDPFVHRLMGACVGASIQLACKAKGITYIPRHDILSRHDKVMELPLSHTAPQKSLVPDELFGLDYGGSYRFFACEWDRGTEPIRRKALDQTDFGKKIACYLEVMRARTFKEVWGTPNLMTLIVTTNETRAKSLREEVQVLDPKLAQRFLFKVVDNFASPWRMPPVLIDILEPWTRADGTTFDITTP